MATPNFSSGTNNNNNIKRRHQIEVDVQRANDEFNGNKRLKLSSAFDSRLINRNSTTPLTPLSQQQKLELKSDLNTTSTNQQLEKSKLIGPYRLLPTQEDNPQYFTAIDTRNEQRLVICRRLDRSKYEHLTKVADRLLSEDRKIMTTTYDEDEDNQKSFEQIFPSKSEILTGDDGFYYYFEPKHFGSLHAYVVERKKLSEQECLAYARQIVRLLVYCHQRRIVLRDLKLRKFVFADSEHSVIRLDGIDELFLCPDANDNDNDDDRSDEVDDQISDRHGCPAYVGPEILDLNKKSYSGRAADIWSFGVLLFVMLYGRYPFYDTTPARLFAKIRHGQIQMHDEIGISFEVRTLIRCLLRRDPSERPSATEIFAHPWLQSGDRMKTSSRHRQISMVSTANGIRFVMIERESENDQRVPCFENGNQKKTKNGKEYRQPTGNEVPN